MVNCDAAPYIFSIKFVQQNRKWTVDTVLLKFFIMFYYLIEGQCKYEQGT